MKKSNVYNIANNAINSKDFKISLIDQRALSIIEEIPDEKLDNFLFNPKDQRLWILNRSLDGRIIGAQCRRMRGKGSRYLTYDLSKIIPSSQFDNVFCLIWLSSVTKKVLLHFGLRHMRLSD